jgi:hypothetical protein
MSTPDLLPVPLPLPLTMSTNLLAMPFIDLSILTANNEDWIDSIVYLHNSTDLDAPQLDIRGIEFFMEVRRAPPNHEVVIRASLENGMLAIGDPPNFGYLLIRVPHETVKLLVESNYVGDIVGYDGQVTRRVIALEIAMVEGITRP